MPRMIRTADTAVALALNSHECGYVPGGTYGIKRSADCRTLFANLNGHAPDGARPESMKTKGFGLCAFAAIHIPEAETR